MTVLNETPQPAALPVTFDTPGIQARLGGRVQQVRLWPAALDGTPLPTDREFPSSGHAVPRPARLIGCTQMRSYTLLGNGTERFLVNGVPCTQAQYDEHALPLLRRGDLYAQLRERVISHARTELRAGRSPQCAVTHLHGLLPAYGPDAWATRLLYFPVVPVPAQA